jgi:hypothetical protein
MTSRKTLELDRLSAYTEAAAKPAAAFLRLRNLLSYEERLLLLHGYQDRDEPKHKQGSFISSWLV